MIAGEKKPFSVEQYYAASCMARHGNDLKLCSDSNRLLPSNHPFCSRSGIAIRLMDDAFRAEMRGILIRIRHVILVCQKDLGDASPPLKGFNEMLDVPRRVDQPVAVLMFNKKTIRSERFL